MNERDIFLLALQREDPDQRRAYLAEACQGDEELRRGVEALLAVHERAGSFLAGPALGGSIPDNAAPLREGPGTIIGPYKLLEQIGEGGFGIVYMAEQERPVRRKVALKVLKLGLDTRQVVARFEAERQALALMDHPNIARVFDGGETFSGRPYFVMELVRGVPITDFCDANALPVRQRLDLFISVCQAVQHAHQKGIIHRDLKPTNVLVTLHDGTPVVKIIDFGISKALGQQLTEKTLFTNFAQMIGTPIYMSPEQAEMSGLDIDTRSDIYSLGVLLYELLTGTTPRDQERLRTAAYDEVRRIIREEEPDKPSTRMSTPGEASRTASAKRQSDPRELTQLLRGELDWIVMKALEKDRNRRYETASAFAADVQRYLDDEPVQACPPTAVYRLRKFGRRHRSALSLAGLFFGLVMVAGVVSAWLAVRATLAERQALADRDRAQQEKDRAETSYKLARGALEEVVKLEDDARFQQGSLEDVRRTLLQAEAAFYQKFVEQRGDDPGFQSERVGAFLRLAEVTGSLASKEEAIQHGQQALVISQDLASQYPDIPGYQADLARSHDTLARLYEDTGRYREAEAAGRNAIEISERLVREYPTIAPYQSQLVREHFHRCGLYRRTGRLKQAEASGRNAISVSDQLASNYPTVPQYQAALCRSYLALEDVLRNSGRHQEAEASLKHSLAIAERLTREHPEVTDYQAHLARSQHDLAIVYMDMRRYEEALDSYRSAIGITERMVRDHPSVAENQDQLAANYGNLGIAYMDTGRYNEAEDWLLKALTLRERLARDHPTVTEYRADLANIRIVLAGNYARSDHPDKAEGVLKGISKDALNVMGLYNLGCVYALFAPAPGKSPEKHADAAERQKRADEYAARAVDVLREAVAKGFGNVPLMQTDHDLDSLRSRDDFKKLLAELEQKLKK
jgi:serine/threonine protein kinase/tetratricopeptide (TPR) repeat protein